MADGGTRSFSLVAKFEDRITPNLKRLNKEIDGIRRKFERFNKSLNTTERDLKRVSNAMRGLGTAAMNTQKSVNGLGGSLRNTSRAAGASVQAMDRYSASMRRATVAARNLSAANNIKPARGLNVGGAGNTGSRRGRDQGSGSGAVFAGTLLGGGALLAASAAASTIGNSVRRAFGFVGDQFRAAVEDEIADAQATGSLFGALKEKGMLGPLNYDYGEKISRSLDVAIGKKVAQSPVPTEMITLYSRTLSDNLLPELLKGKDIKSEKVLREASTYLGDFYETMGLLTPKGYSPEMVSRAFTKALGGASLKSLERYDFFQLNPQFSNKLMQLGFDSAKSVSERMEMLNEAMKVAMPPQTKEKIRASLAAGYQGIADNLTNVTTGLLSFAADFGDRTATYLGRDANNQLVEMSKVIYTPFQQIGALVAPAMIEFSNVISATVDKLGPLTKYIADAMDRMLGEPFRALTRNLAGVADMVTSGAYVDYGTIFGKTAGYLAKFIENALNSLTSGSSDFMTKFSAAFSSVMSIESFKKLVGKITDTIGQWIGTFVQWAIPLVTSAIGQAITTMVTKGGLPGLITGALITKSLVDPILDLFAFVGESARGAVVAASKAMKPLATRPDDITMLRALGNHPDQFLKGLVLPKASQVKGLANLWKGMDKGGGLMTRFLQGLSTSSKYLRVMGKSTALFSGIISAFVAAFEGKGLAGILAAALGGGGGSAVGGAIGFALGGPIGAAIGSVLGGTLGSNKQITGSLEQVFKELAPLGSIFTDLGSIIEDVVFGIGDLLKSFGFLDNSVAATKGELSGLQSTIALLKILLFPLTATLHALQVIIGIVALAFKGLRVAILQLRLWMSDMNPWKDQQKRKALEAELYAATDDANKGLDQFGTMLWKNNEYYSGWFDADKYAKVEGTKNTLFNSQAVLENTGVTQFNTEVLGANAAAAGANTESLGLNSTAVGANTGAARFNSQALFENSGAALFNAESLGLNSTTVWTNTGANQLNTESLGLNSAAAGINTEATKLSALTTQEKTKAVALAYDQQVASILGLNQSMDSSASNMMAIFTNLRNIGQNIPGQPNSPGFTGGGSGGPGYGAAGVAHAAGLGDFIKMTGGAPGSIGRQDSHGGRPTSGHSANSLHYSGRAIDIGANAWEQGDVIRRVQEYNRINGLTPTEFLHAGNDANHQDHVHVAYARGLGAPRQFNSFLDAIRYERHAMPSGARAVYNSSETLGGGGVTINGGITVNAGPGSDSKEIAANVADEILNALSQMEMSTIA